MYSCFYSITDYQSCLDSGDDKGNVVYTALEKKTCEGKENLEEFAQELLEHLYLADKKFKEEQEEYESIITKHREAEKQELLKTIEGLSIEEKYLVQMAQEILGENKVVGKLKEAFETGDRELYSETVSTLTGEISTVSTFTAPSGAMMDGLDANGEQIDDSQIPEEEEGYGDQEDFDGDNE